MRKELIAVILFCLVLLTAGSLASYHDQDPSIHHATAGRVVHNTFGLFGAHLSGMLVGLFGLGAFWIPLAFLLITIQVWRRMPRAVLGRTMGGALLLAVATGALFALAGDHLEIFGRRFSSGGLLGIPLKTLAVHYANVAGCVVLLSVLWLVGLMLSTGFSLVVFYQRLALAGAFIGERLRTFIIKHRERTRKARKRKKNIQRHTPQAKQEIAIRATAPQKPKRVAPPKQAVFEFERKSGDFELPPLNLLDDPEDRPNSINAENLKMQSKLLEKKLDDFGVEGRVVTVSPGPVITTFEYEPAPGVKINRIVNLSDDLAMALRAVSIRIEAPIPGKSVIGIEVPNLDREMVRLKEIVSSEEFTNSRSPLTVSLGKDIVGNPVAAELERMPHLLIAGATGTGKSVGLNAMITSILFKSTPSQVKFIMVDPKRIELSLYDGIPHLITPVVTVVKKATNALYWAVREMERRYELLSQHKVRNLAQYNKKIAKKAPSEEAEGEGPLPLIVVVIDELADLMMVASRDVEVALTRLAQMARAAGIHLILATQRPSVDVLTGLIKANFPTRISFQVSSKTDSRTIIDNNGAETLLGNGDMLFLPPGTGQLRRIHGAYISEEELGKIIEYLKSQGQPEYMDDVTAAPVEEASAGADEEHDERYDEAVALVTQNGQASISMVQRHLRIGYNRAARIIEMMEREGVVGPADGAKPREVLVRGYDNAP